MMTVTAMKTEQECSTILELLTKSKLMLKRMLSMVLKLSKKKAKLHRTVQPRNLQNKYRQNYSPRTR